MLRKAGNTPHQFHDTKEPIHFLRIVILKKYSRSIASSCTQDTGMESSKKSPMIDLPFDILYLIQTFSSPNINNFLKTCKSMWMYRKRLHELRLNGTTSRLFCDDPKARETIMSYADKNACHVHLDLHLCEQIQNLNVLENIYSIDLYCSWNIANAFHFRNAHTLDLTNCFSISDVSMLGNVHHLVLSGCYRIRDVSALLKVHKLDLSRCPRITDVSALGNTYYLDLSYCPNIGDVSALSKLHTLKLRCCNWGGCMTGVEHLGGLHTLDLRDCNQIQDVDYDVLSDIILLQITNTIFANKLMPQASEEVQS